MKTVRWRVEEFEEIDSTNTWVAQAARTGAPAGLVARADYQSAGRGRLDRQWESPRRASLLVSFLLRPELREEDLHLTTVAVALAARAAVVRLCGVRPALKWPNDLIVEDAKLGGVLAEAVRDNDGHLAVVVGLGLNLTSPGPPGAGGTSVVAVSGITVDPRAMLDLVIDELDTRAALLDDGHSDVLRVEFEGALATMGRRVRVERPLDMLEGTAVGVDGSGRLILDTGTERVLVAVGDIVHLRDATETA